MLESTGSTVDEWRERSAPCRFRFLPRSGPSTPSVQPSRPAPAPVAALRRIRQSPRTSRSDRSLRAMPDSRFGLSLLPACGLRCRSPSHTSERYVPVRHAAACSGRETNDTDRLSGVSEVLAETRLRVQALSGARAAPSPHHPERAHESLRSGPLPGSGRCIRAKLHSRRADDHPSLTRRSLAVWRRQSDEVLARLVEVDLLRACDPRCRYSFHTI